MHRILYANFFHETHTFLPGLTGLDDFSIANGNEVFNLNSGRSSPRDGFFEVAYENQWQVIPCIDMIALPSSTLSDETVEFFWDEFNKKLNDENYIDGIFLVLHGASVSESYMDVEGEIYKRIRNHKNGEKLPIAAVCDYHANVSVDMIKYSQVLIPYRNNPHTDAKEASRYAATHLQLYLEENVKLTTKFKLLSRLISPYDSGTEDEPIATIQKMCRAWEKDLESVVSVNFFAGFAYADTPCCSASFSVIFKNESVKNDKNFIEMENLISKTLASPHGKKIIQSDQWVPKYSGNEPCIIAEPSDNIGAGTTGDGTGLLRLFLKHDLDHALVVINDPESVHKCSGLKISEEVKLNIGGHTLPFDQGPIALESKLISHHEGKFTLLDKKSHLASMGYYEVDMGPTCVLKYRGITIVLTTIKTPPFDLGQIKSLGLNPKEFKFIGVKAAVAHRKAYNEVSSSHIAIETPGPCPQNLNSLPYKNLERPIVPLDPVGV